MPTDRFVSLAMAAQIKNGEFYIVTHAHSIVHIQSRYDELSMAYARYAPRYAGDDEYDVRTILGRRQK